MSSSHDTPKNWFGTTIDGARAGASGATRWSETHLPGGAKTFWAVIGLILLGVLIVAIRPGEQARTNGRGGFGGPMPVGAAAVSKGDIAITLNALGTVTPLATVTVRPQVSGQIVRFNFQEGQMVKAGAVLAEIDPRTYKAAYDQAVGQAERDKATLANAQVDLKRDEALYAQKAVSQQVLATQQALVRSTAATVKSDQAAVESAAINLGYTRVTSPVTGRVGLRQVDIGNLVQAGQTNGIVVVTQEQPISVMFALPEDNISDIMTRVNQGATLSVEAYDRGQTVKLATGKLATVDNVIDPTTGTVKMRAMFDNPDDALFPNQFVNVRLLVNTLHDQTWVPASAIERGSQGAFVYIVQSDNTVAMRTVSLGPQDGDKIAITKGLNPGENVVTDGADRLRDGSEVTVAKGPKTSTVKAPAEAASGDDERAKRRAAITQACGEDIKKYCPTAQGMERFQCMREHRDDFSDTCKAAMSKMRRHGSGGGQ
ncbi:MAG TPA: MdtA/MuxA family multidrug efflux RND transporter periplasmic adaptor subunit [Rhizomicrobium sp.]|nr:MdtA/MuxA family multidrug efflux RND transporter periplasmic adaptor subunit [Rhizomicrobium sp.]